MQGRIYEFFGGGTGQEFFGGGGGSGSSKGQVRGNFHTEKKILREGYKKSLNTNTIYTLIFLQYLNLTKLRTGTFLPSFIFTYSSFWICGCGFIFAGSL